MHLILTSHHYYSIKPHVNISHLFVFMERCIPNLCLTGHTCQEIKLFQSCITNGARKESFGHPPHLS